MLHQFSSSLTQEQKLLKEKKHVPALNKLNEILYEQHGCFFDTETYKQYDGNSPEHMQKQKAGIDAECELVFLKTGKRVTVTWDYKFRFKDYPDFLAETVSVDCSNKPGWAVDPDKKNHFILNINVVTKQVVLVNRIDLRNAILDGKFSDLKERESSTGGRQKSYKTKFITIPLNRLKEECPKTIVFKYE